MSSSTRQFAILGVEEWHAAVELWSSTRLPFEPKGWLVDMRGELRAALLGLSPNQDEILHAMYSSNIEGMFDIENILFYNVGAAFFPGCVGRGIRFERSFDQPEPAPATTPPFDHFQRYAVAPRNGMFRCWTPGRAIVSWDRVECRPLGSLTNPAWVWYPMKKSEIQMGKSRAPKRFGLRVRLQTGQGRVVNPVSVVKPLFDGIISAFHAHDGTALGQISGSIARLLNVEPAEVTGQLADTKQAVLGHRTLVRPRRGGVGFGWNPGDDGCVTAELLLEQSGSGAGWLISGELFEVEPLPVALAAAE